MTQQIQNNKIEWKEIKLKELIEDMHQGINTVTEKINYSEKGYPIIQSKHITGGSLDFSDARFLDKEDFDFYKNKYNPKKGDVLICNIGTIGKSIVIRDKNNFLIAWNLFLIKLQKDKVSPVFFKFYLDELYSKKLFDKMLSGGTVKFINKSKMGSIKIPLPFSNGKPDLKEQERIVSILEKAEKQKENSKKVEELLDEYLKSVFNEMFGDPVKNEKQFPTKKGNKLFKFSSGKFNPTKNLSENYPYPTFGGNGITGLSKEYLIDFNTIVIGRVGAYCGSIYLTPKKCWITDNAIFIKEFKEKIDLIFCYWVFRFLRLNRFALTVGQPKITQKPLEELNFIYPPLLLQQKFAKIVEHVEKIKENIKKTKQNSEELFNSLMTKAFRGEL